jgi:hypothetical protein
MSSGHQKTDVDGSIHVQATDLDLPVGPAFTGSRTRVTGCERQLSYNRVVVDLTRTAVFSDSILSGSLTYAGASKRFANTAAHRA